jgi:hypothetical protein
MNMKCVTEDMRKALKAPLPPEAVTKHPTKTYLSSIKAIYVTERLNDVFGIGGWQLRTEMVERSDKGTVVVKDVFTVPEYNIYYEAFGGNDNGGENSKNFDLGDAYKGASTDALTKICSYLEIGIDVFKGLHGKGSPKKDEEAPAKETKPKEWLNPGTELWTKVAEKMAKGVMIDKVKESYNISKVNETKLLAEAAILKVSK